LADACVLVAARGRLMQALPENGAMLAVQAPEEAILPLLDGRADRIGIAAVNGPRSVVVSGERTAVEELAGVLAGQGRKVRRLNVSHAFHSPLMEPMLAEFRAVAEGVTFRPPRIPVVSNVTGRVADPAELCTAEYWVRHVREPVRFADGVTALYEQGVRTYLELGPDAVLTPLTGEILARDSGTTVVAALHRDHPETHAVTTAAARLHAGGRPVDWRAVLPSGARRTDLPGYPFQRRRYWLDAPAVAASTEDTLFWRAVEGDGLDFLATELGLAGDGRAALARIAPALAAWRRHRDCWYRVAWQPVPEPPASALSGTWLVVTPATGLDEKLLDGVLDALSGHGATPLCLTPDEALAPGGAAAAPDRELGTGAPEVTGVLSLLALGEPGPAGPDDSATLETTTRLLTALCEADLTAPVWLATLEAVPADRSGERVDPGQAALWGLGRAAGGSGPLASGGLLDLPAVLDSRARGRLAAVLAGGTGEREMAVRASGLFARRLVESSAQSAPAHRWQPRGTVLVHGGAGGLGAEVARWAAREGAAGVILTGAGGAAEDADLVAELESLGCPVTVSAADGREPAPMAALLAAVPAERPLTAVVHAVPAPDDPSAAMRALRTLHELTTGADLEVFAVFTTFDTLGPAVGEPTAGPGAAVAAAFGDALVRARCRDGLPGTCVTWGPWAPGPAEPWLRPLVPGMVLGRLPAHTPQGTLVVADIDFDAVTPHEVPRLVAALPRLRRDTGADRADGPADLSARLAGLPTAAREELLLDVVRSHAAAVLATSATDVDVTQNFLELGFASLTILELCNAVRDTTGLELVPQDVFEHPTPAALAACLTARSAE
ncbi:acyltransferase domain-containing protein, partial [Streptomyces achromogenes]|uniref:acyltransferase domain-containing protein n=1 Tax=Streptomyces achromogenes TaxID=67255 RepID=UPI0036FD67C0